MPKKQYSNIKNENDKVILNYDNEITKVVQKRPNLKLYFLAEKKN